MKFQFHFNFCFKKKDPLLLRELTKSTPKEFGDYKNLEKAEEKVKQLLVNINEKTKVGNTFLVIDYHLSLGQL